VVNGSQKLFRECLLILVKRSRCSFSTLMPRSPVRLSVFDAFFGFQKIIDATWFFPGSLDSVSLRHSLDEFSKLHPSFACRIGRSNDHAINPFSGYNLQEQPHQHIPLTVLWHDGNIANIAPSTHAVGDGGASFVQSSLKNVEDIMTGSSPVMSVTLTEFSCGGSALGVCMSHGIADASGFHRAVSEWARIHRCIQRQECTRLKAGEQQWDPCGMEEDIDEGLAAHQLLTSRNLLFDAAASAAVASKADKGGGATAATATANGATVLDFSGFWGAMSWWALRRVSSYGVSQRGRARRAVLSFARRELAVLAAQHDEQRRVGGGTTVATATTDTATTGGEAIAGAVLRELVKCTIGSGNTTAAGAEEGLMERDAKDKGDGTRRGDGTSYYQIVVPANMRGGRMAMGLPEEFVGNAVHSTLRTRTIRVPPPSSPTVSTCCEFTAALHDIGKELRNNPQEVGRDWLQQYHYLDAGLLVQEQAELSADVTVTALVVNSQRRLVRTSTMAHKELFGPDGGECIRMLPGPSDTIQLLPARDMNGAGAAGSEGIDVLINLPPELLLPSERHITHGRVVHPPAQDWIQRVQCSTFRDAVLSGVW
jgi:hypothetical protein